jgi:hypothetical protein
MAVSRKKSGKKLKKGFILGGCLLLAILGLFLLSTPTSPEPTTREVNAMEVRENLQPASDAYMLAETTAERQAAARAIRSTKDGSRSVNPDTTAGLLTILRGVLWLTIVVLSWQIITLAFPVLQPRKAKMV